MYPLYHDGDYVLLSKVFYQLHIGDLIVFRHLVYGVLIKKIAHIKKQNIFVIGAKQDSIDSREFGYIEKRVIIGKVFFCIRKKA